MSRYILKDLVDFKNGYAFKSKFFSNTDGIPLIRIRDIKNSTTKTYYFGEYDNDFIVKNGDFLIGMDGNFEIAQWKGKDSLLNQRVCTFKIKDNNLSEKYLYYFLKIKLKQIEDVTGYTTVKHLSINTLKNIVIEIPSLQVQEKIVERLQISTSSINSKLKNVENQKLLVQNLFESYVNKIVHTNEIKGVLGDFMTIQRGGSPRPIGKYLTNDEDGLNWIKISDGTNSSKYIKETKEKITKEGLNKTREVKPGDFILSNSMSFGRPYIMKIPGCIHDGWLKLSDYEKYFDIDFLYYFLGSKDIFQKFNNASRGSTVKNLNTNIVSNIEVGIPSLENQKEIAKKIIKFEKEIEKYSNYLVNLDSLYKNLNLSIFNKEFSYE